MTLAIFCQKRHCFRELAPDVSPHLCTRSEISRGELDVLTTVVLRDPCTRCFCTPYRVFPAVGCQVCSYSIVHALQANNPCQQPPEQLPPACFPSPQLVASSFTHDGPQAAFASQKGQSSSAPTGLCDSSDLRLYGQRPPRQHCLCGRPAMRLRWT